jgi:hypothetical protein
MGIKDYPEWVLKHKAKGTELRNINGKFYLYQIHCERIDGKNKKITDKYLGRITEDGLIPPAIKEIHPVVKELGSTAFVFSVCQKIIMGMKIKYPKRYRKLIPLAICKALYHDDISLYKQNYLSVLYPVVIIKKETESIQAEIVRIANMMTSQIKKTIGNDSWEDTFKILSGLYIVKVKDQWSIAEYDQEVKTIIEKYNIGLGFEYGKD